MHACAVMSCCALQGILAANGDSPLEGDPDEWDKLFKVHRCRLATAHVSKVHAFAAQCVSHVAGA